MGQGPPALVPIATYNPQRFVAAWSRCNEIQGTVSWSVSPARKFTADAGVANLQSTLELPSFGPSSSPSMTNMNLCLSSQTVLVLTPGRRPSPMPGGPSYPVAAGKWLGSDGRGRRREMVSGLRRSRSRIATRSRSLLLAMMWRVILSEVARFIEPLSYDIRYVSPHEPPDEECCMYLGIPAIRRRCTCQGIRYRLGRGSLSRLV